MLFKNKGLRFSFKSNVFFRCLIVCVTIFGLGIEAKLNAGNQKNEINEIQNINQLDSTLSYLDGLSEKIDSKQDSIYSKISENCFKYLRDHSVPGKLERLKLLARIGSKFRNAQLQIAVNEYYIQLPEIKNTREYIEGFYYLAYAYSRIENYSRALYYYSKFLNSCVKNKYIYI